MVRQKRDSLCESLFCLYEGHVKTIEKKGEFISNLLHGMFAGMK